MIENVIKGRSDELLAKHTNEENSILEKNYSCECEDEPCDLGKTML